MKKIYLMLVLLLLSGCQTYYKNPRGGNFENDKNECSNQSRNNVCRTIPQTSETRCSIDQFSYPRGQEVCKTVTYPAREQCNLQVNDNQVQMCLRQKGWQEISKEEHDRLFKR